MTRATSRSVPSIGNSPSSGCTPETRCSLWSSRSGTERPPTTCSRRPWQEGCSACTASFFGTSARECETLQKMNWRRLCVLGWLAGRFSRLRCESERTARGHVHRAMFFNSTHGFDSFSCLADMMQTCADGAGKTSRCPSASGCAVAALKSFPARSWDTFSDSTTPPPSRKTSCPFFATTSSGQLRHLWTTFSASLPLLSIRVCLMFSPISSASATRPCLSHQHSSVRMGCPCALRTGSSVDPKPPHVLKAVFWYCLFVLVLFDVSNERPPLCAIQVHLLQMVSRRYSTK